jgi:hypothetical protein
MAQTTQNKWPAGSATLTPEAIKAMSSNDIAIFATQRADIPSADCIRAVTELAFSGRTWRKDWQRHTLSLTFANSPYFQANPTHRDKTIDALVAMKAEAEWAATAAGGGTQPPLASGNVPHVPSAAADAAAGQGCAGSATLTPEAIKAMSPNDIVPSTSLAAAPAAAAHDPDMDPDLLQAILNSLAPPDTDDVTFSKRVPDLAVRTIPSDTCKSVLLFYLESDMVIDRLCRFKCHVTCTLWQPRVVCIPT